MPNPWEMDWSQPQAAPTGGGGLIAEPLPEKPKTPAAQTPAQAQKDALEVTKLQRELAKTPETNPELQQAIKGLGLDELLTGVGRAREHVGTGWATGIPGSIANLVPGSPRRNFLGILGGIKGGITMEKLQALKDASKTGASGMGSLTEQEGERLASSVAALADDMSQEEIEKSLDIVERHAKFLQAVGAGKDPNDPAVQKEYGIKPLSEEKKQEGLLPYTEASRGAEGQLTAGPLQLPPDGGTPPSDGDSPQAPRPQGMSPEQAAVYDSFMSKYPKASAAQIKLLGRSLGFEVDNAEDIVKARDAGGGVQPGSTSVPFELLKSAGNTAAGLVSGIGALPDMAAKAIGSGLAIPAEALGFENVARDLNNPTTIGGMVEKVAPTPQDWPGWLNRKASEFTGGVMGFPAKAGQYIADEIVGQVPKFSNYLTKQAANEAGNVARAAEQEGVSVSRPMVDASKRAKMGYLESTIGGGQPIREGMSKTLSGIERRAGQLADEGVPQERGLMGQRVQSAVTRDLGKQRAGASNLYKEAAALVGDAPIEGREIAGELTSQITKLERNPNSNRALIDYLRTVRADFVDESGNLIPKTVDDIRNVRTNLAAEINSRNLTQSNAERIINQALTKGGRDIERDLLDAGPAGARAKDIYREADIRWRLAKRDEKQIAEKLLGPADNNVTGKATMDRAMQWLASSGENGTHAARFWAKLNPQEQADFAATVASRFGRQAADEPFSPAQFISATRPIPPSSRALMFGKEGAQSIANLRQLTKAYQDTAKFLNNSRSGQVINWNNEIKGLLTRGGIGGLVGSMAAGPIGGVAGAAIGASGKMALEKMSARSLMNPDVSRWLSVAPRQTDEKSILQHIAKLPGIAARNPAIEREVLNLQQSLLSSLSGTPLPRVGALAAESPEQRPDNAEQ